MSKYRTRVPVVPDLAARILRAAEHDENGCLVSAIHPSQKRPSVKIPGGGMVLVTRIVMAVALGRCIEPDEDVHHCGCRTIRCVNPAHLQVIPASEHTAHHGAELRLEICPRHQTPYDRRDRRGKPHCRKCEAAASARYRRNHPDYRRPPLTEAQRLRRSEWDRLRRTARRAA